jgi:hypothetical protein
MLSGCSRGRSSATPASPGKRPLLRADRLLTDSPSIVSPHTSPHSGGRNALCNPTRAHEDFPNNSANQLIHKERSFGGRFGVSLRDDSTPGSSLRTRLGVAFTNRRVLLSSR